MTGRAAPALSPTEIALAIAAAHAVAVDEPTPEFVVERLRQIFAPAVARLVREREDVPQPAAA